MQGCIFSIVVTDALVLKHQAISIQNADGLALVLGLFHTKDYLCSKHHLKLKLLPDENDPDI